jgi:hypothetical protein
MNTCVDCTDFLGAVNLLITSTRFLNDQWRFTNLEFTAAILSSKFSGIRTTAAMQRSMSRLRELTQVCQASCRHLWIDEYCWCGCAEIGAASFSRGPSKQKPAPIFVLVD